MQLAVAQRWNECQEISMLNSLVTNTNTSTLYPVVLLIFIIFQIFFVLFQVGNDFKIFFLPFVQIGKDTGILVQGSLGV